MRRSSGGQPESSVLAPNPFPVSPGQSLSFSNVFPAPSRRERYSVAPYPRRPERNSSRNRRGFAEPFCLPFPVYRVKARDALRSVRGGAAAGKSIEREEHHDQGANRKEFLSHPRVRPPVPRSARLLAFVALVALGLMFTPRNASAAGCAVPYVSGAPVLAPLANPRLADEPNQPFSIVGLWHLNYTGTYDDNFPPNQPATPPFPFLESYKTWHADGTEFENAFLPPAGGNICFGVWKDLGRGTVKLHHVGLMFDPVTGAVANVFTVDEIDTVAPNGKTYKGTFDFKLFDATDVFGTGTPIAEVITVN
jgi:hypothetical protein